MSKMFHDVRNYGNNPSATGIDPDDDQVGKVPKRNQHPVCDRCEGTRWEPTTPILFNKKQHEAVDWCGWCHGRGESPTRSSPAIPLWNPAFDDCRQGCEACAQNRPTPEQWATWPPQARVDWMRGHMQTLTAKDDRGNWAVNRPTITLKRR